MKNFNIIDVGSTTKKKIKPITIGEIIKPSKIPKFIHIIFSGKRIFEFNKPNIRKMNDKLKKQKLISLPLLKKYMVTIKKNIKKTIPKFLFDGKSFFLYTNSNLVIR